MIKEANASKKGYIMADLVTHFETLALGLYLPNDAFGCGGDAIEDERVLRIDQDFFDLED